MVAGLQVPAGHHCYPGYGRAVRGGQAQGRQGQEDREVPLPAVPGQILGYAKGNNKEVHHKLGTLRRRGLFWAKIKNVNCQGSFVYPMSVAYLRLESLVLVFDSIY